MKETPMPAAKPLAMVCALALLSACEMKVGKEADKGEAIAKGAGGSAVAAAEGKAEEGQFSIKAPGFDMKIDIPAGVTSHGDSDSDVLYPGSTLSGMHIEGAKRGGDGKGNAGIELRFTTPDAPEKVAAWYRDPARASGFSVSGMRREEADFIIAGTEKKDGDPFTLRLSPRGDGTEGRLTLTDRS
jgi:hypothetical protein